MSALFKFITRLLLLLVVLLVIVVIAVPAFLDPNDFKEEIVSQVQQATGRDLRIDGDLELSVFPWLGLKTGALTVGNSTGFDSEPFAEMAAADVSVKLLPLLNGRVETQTITLKGLRLNLSRDADGKANWQQSTPAGEAPVEAPVEAQAGQSPASKPMTFAVGGIVIEDAELHWRDLASGQSLVLDDIDINTGAVVHGQPITVHLDMGVNNQQPQMHGKVELDTVAVLEADDRTLRLQGLKLVLDLLGKGLPNGKLQASLQGDGGIDLDNKALKLAPLKLGLDESKLNGEIDIQAADKPQIGFRLVVDQLDLDAYAMPDDGQMAAAESPAATTAPAAAVTAGGPSGNTGATAETASAPLQLLRDLNLDGSIRIGHLTVSRMHFQDVIAEVRAADGVLKLEPADLKLYGGGFDGMLSLDARGERLKSRLQWTLDGVQLGQLLQDLNGKQSLSGTANLKADLSALGNTAEAITGSLSGNGNLALVDGAYTGIDLLYQLRLAKALFKGKNLPAPGRAVTDFAELLGSFQVRNGVIDNRDLSAKSPVLRVKGGGTIDLPAAGLNYGLKLKITGSLEGQTGKDLEKLKGYEIPMTLSGPLADPKVGVDLEELLKGELGNQLKKKFGKKLDEKLGGLLGTGQGGEDAGSSGDRLKDVIPGALKGLFR